MLFVINIFVLHQMLQRVNLIKWDDTNQDMSHVINYIDFETKYYRSIKISMNEGSELNQFYQRQWRRQNVVFNGTTIFVLVIAQGLRP